MLHKIYTNAHLTQTVVLRYGYKWFRIQSRDHQPQFVNPLTLNIQKELICIRKVFRNKSYPALVQNIHEPWSIYYRFPDIFRRRICRLIIFVCFEAITQYPNDFCIWMQLISNANWYDSCIWVISYANFTISYLE